MKTIKNFVYDFGHRITEGPSLEALLLIVGILLIIKIASVYQARAAAAKTKTGVALHDHWLVWMFIFGFAIIGLSVIAGGGSLWLLSETKDWLHTSGWKSIFRFLAKLPWQLIILVFLAYHIFIKGIILGGGKK